MFATVSRSRLLPMSVPFRFFGAAAVFQCLAWLVLAFFSAEILSFNGGLGPVFAALHLLTLGVLVMAAIGASLQLLPVATRQPVRSVGAAKLAWWLLVPGVLLFAGGAAHYAPRVMAGGAVAVMAALGIYGTLLLRNLFGARGLPVVVAHGWAALACLAGLAATGLALVARYEHGLALDHGAFRAAHLVLAAYGFMGLLALGFSTFLLPMLAVAPPPPPRGSYAALALACVAIALGALGWRMPATALGLCAALLHVFLMERSLRLRLRPQLSGGFELIRASWALLPLSLLASLAVDSEKGALLFGLLLVPGWLLSFLLGVMQHIVPFLASVHASAVPHGRPLISAMTPAPLLGAHRALHLVALAALLGAALLELPWLAAAGAAAGLGGAVAFAAFVAFVLIKVRQHGNAHPPHQPAPA